MQKIEFRRSDNGELITAPMAVYELDNRPEKFIVIGADFDQIRQTIIWNKDSPHLEVNQIGKLNDQGFINRDRIRATLFLDGWDWQQFPNPEILICKDNSFKEKLNIVS